MLPDEVSPEIILSAVTEGVRRALIEHKRAGNPVPAWRDGRVVMISAEELEIPEPSERWAHRPVRPNYRL